MASVQAIIKGDSSPSLYSLKTQRKPSSVNFLGWLKVSEAEMWTQGLAKKGLQRQDICHIFRSSSRIKQVRIRL